MLRLVGNFEVYLGGGGVPGEVWGAVLKGGSCLNVKFEFVPYSKQSPGSRLTSLLMKFLSIIVSNL